MITKHTKSSRHNTIRWTGGTTTELSIYPKDASYSDKNFLFRISTATIETEESQFTKLPGVSRKIMILEGEIKIEHKDHYSKVLKKFDQDEFKGDWDTKSYGKAVDFNLMSSGNIKTEIEARNTLKNCTLTSNAEFTGIYCYQGRIKIKIDDSLFEMLSGDFLLIQKDNAFLNAELLPAELCEIIITKINRN